jgi:hypothetical protein
VIDLIVAIASETLRTLLLAAPFLLLGLVVAGLLHVLLPTSFIQRWMGRPGLSGVSMAAFIGVPLPVCSCGVVPISVELRRKGASLPASQSFLITTPESSIDSILFTYGLMGPVLAVARPVAAFFTAVLGGVMSIAWLDEEEAEAGKEVEAAPSEDPCCGHDHGDGDEDHDHSHGVSYEGAPRAHAALGAFLRRPYRRERIGELDREVVRPSLRYGFGELLDDLAFWLFLGVVLAGVLGALLPSDLSAWGLGEGLLPMVLMLLVGIPLYMCASASTPIAAALMAKGISPGAALVFLLAGPATNAATLVLLTRTFGRRFVQIYLSAVVLGALLSGLALDYLAVLFGWSILAPLTTGGEGYSFIEWASCAVLSVVLLRSLWWRGAWRRGASELRQGLAGLLPADPERRARWGRRGLLVLVLAALIGWLGSGLFVVPPDSSGYVFRFGALVEGDLEPGLHYALPAPLGSARSWRTGYPRKADIGFEADLGLLARRRELTRYADPDAWHSTVAAMNPNPEQATFLTADENLVEVSFTVHYGLSEPRRFFYGIDRPNAVVRLYAEAVARELIAGQPIEELLTERREKVQEDLRRVLVERLEAVGAGIEVRAVHIVDVHPPGGAVFAFRDVSSAREDKETRIHRAHELDAREVPRARGEAALLLARAVAAAEAREKEAAARAGSFQERARVIARDRRILEHLLWIETVERVLAGREKIILPGGTADTDVTLWRTPPTP